jgi:hypothetical protein
VDGKMMERGRPVFVLSFQALNAVEVTVDPPVIPTLRGAPMGRFAIAPDKTTTYTLKVVGKRGHMAEKKVTVEVGPPAS